MEEREMEKLHQLQRRFCELVAKFQVKEDIPDALVIGILENVKFAVYQVGLEKMRLKEQEAPPPCFEKVDMPDMPDFMKELFGD